MNKKIFISFCLVIFIVIIIGLGYYFFYQKPDVPLEEESSETEECGMLTNAIVDGIFQEVRNNSIYIQPKGEEDSVETIKLTNETTFLEMILSEEMEIIRQEIIKLSDFKQGHQISVVALYDELNPEEKTALMVRHMIVE
ncbi:MAG: hypothetical protein ISS88_00120 [Candidatus Portnoybacteria bacterium]|nr:hypothetical protein [Candidatus Portnoybacteria bacterium]